MKVKISNSVLNFRDKLLKHWKLEEWGGVDDPEQELLFFGLFHDRDFEVFHNFKGKKYVFWCGGDILRLQEDYERQRVIKISKNTTHYCETQEQAQKLRDCGIEPIISPSFLGNIDDFPVSFTPPKEGEKWKVFMCAHPNREQEYGLDKAKELAKLFPDVEFHFYGFGLYKEYEGKVPSELDNLPNVIYDGDRVTGEDFDKEIRQYHCGLRCNENDGVSEVVIKSLLLGQYPISKLPYEGVWQYNDFTELVELIKKLKEQKKPNLKAREIWIKKLNNFPWLERK